MNQIKLPSIPRLPGFASILAISLIGGPSLSASYVIDFFPVSDYNANTAAMNTTLGITGYQVDSFESKTLLPGLTISLSGGGIGSPVTLTALANLYNVNSLPESANNEWDGTDALVNNPLNQVPSNSSTDASKLITFNYAPGTTSFGIGLSNFQSLDSPSFPITNHDLYVNGVDLGTIEALAGPNWSPGLIRNAYLVIDATGGSVINSVGFQNDTTKVDFLLFDHLAVQGNVSGAPEPNAFPLLSLGGMALCFFRIVLKRLAVGQALAGHPSMDLRPCVNRSKSDALKG
jgi:hypothetical protein